MAAGENLGARFTIDISELKAGLSQANRLIRESESEFRSAAAGMDDWSSSSDGLQKRIDTLSDQIQIQKEKIAALVQEKQNIIDKMTAEGKSNEEIEKAVDGVNKSIEREGKQLDRLQGSLNKNQSALDKMSNATDDAADSTEDLASETEAAKTPLEKLEDTIEEQEKTLEGLKKEYANAVLEFGSTSDAAKSLAGDIDKLSKDLKTNKDKLDDVSSAADDAGSKAEKSSDGWTVLKDVIADLASQAVQAAADAFKDLLFAGEQALDMLQAKTGMSDKEMSKFGDTAYKVFNKGFGDGINDVTEAMSTVTTMIGEMDEVSLENVTENAMTLADVYGWDVQESIRAVNSMQKQFGVTSDQAFNLMVQGAQKGLDQNGDLLDTINEYSVQFKQAGFTSEEMMNMLANGAKEGTWSVDKLGDAVKEYNVRISDGTVADALNENSKALGMTKKDVQELTKAYGKGGKEGKAAMKKTLDAVLAVEDETERYNLGVQLFGTMWEDLGEDAVKALLDTEGGIKKTNSAMDQTKTDAYDNLATSVTALGRTLKNEILTPIVEAIAPALKDIVGWAIENIDTLKPIIIGVAAAFGVLASALAISGIISTVQKAFALLSATMLANPITLIVAAIAGLVAAFVTLWKNNEGFREFWIGLWDSIKEACGVAVEWIKETFGAFIEFWSGLWEQIKTLLTGAWDGISAFFTETVPKLISSIGDWFSALPGTIWTWLSESIAKVVEWGSSIVSTGTEKATGFYNTVVDWVKKLPASIWQWLWNAFTKVLTWGTQVVTTGTQKFNEFFNAVVDWVKQLPGTIWQWLSDAFAKIVTWGSQVVATGIEKATGFYNAIVDWVKKLPGAIWQWLSDAFTKVVTWGSQVVTTGIQKATGFYNSIVDWVKKLPAAIWQWLSSAFTKVVTWGTQIITTGTQKATGFYNTVVEWVKKLPGEIWNWLTDAAGKVVDWGGDLAKKGLESAKQLFDSVVDKVKEIPGEMLTIGGDIVSGVWKGINGGAEWLKGKIKGWARDIVGWAKGFLGIASPSKVFADQVGENMALGVGVGFTDGMKDVAKDIGAALKDATPNVNVGGSSASGGLASGSNRSVTVYQTNNYAKSHSRYELYKNQQATASAVRLALGGAY